ARLRWALCEVVYCGRRPRLRRHLSELGGAVAAYGASEMRWAQVARLLMAVAVAGVVAIGAEPSAHAYTHSPARPYVVPLGIHKIRHVVIIIQENRSFDNYFGTYPNADGIPGLGGHPGK